MFRTLLLTASTVAVLGAQAFAFAPADRPLAEQVRTGMHLSDVAAVHGDTALSYRLTWSSGDEDAAVRIEVSADPNARPGEGEVIAKKATGGAFEWTAKGAPLRRYFTLIPAKGEPVKTAVRVLPLEGGRNFRDLGGYETADGRVVKWGQVYRSGVMAGLTGADYDYLKSLGVKVVCDFRSDEERESEPTNWQAGEIDYMSWDYSQDSGGEAFAAVFRKPDLKPEDVSAFMASMYAGLAKEHAAKFGAMFDRLAAGEIPLAFNCSAGKDRTGLAAALLLTSLGVPRETIVADYALSEKVVDYMEEFGTTEGASIPENSPYAFLMKLPPDILRPLMRSDPLYIETAFASMEAEYGSVMGFIREELDVTDDELAAIRARLLD